MAKTKKPAQKKGGAAKPAPAKKPMRRKSKRVTALPHVDLTAPKRKPIPSQVADGELRTTVVLKARRNGLSTAAAQHQRHNPRAVAFSNAKRLTASELESVGEASPSAAELKPSLWHRFRSAITGRWVSSLFAKAHADTTVREKVRK